MNTTSMQQTHQKNSPLTITSPEDEAALQRVAQYLIIAKTKVELGQILAKEIAGYTLYDLQVVGGRIHTEMIWLPKSYRNQLSPYLTDQILGGYHRFMTMHRSFRFKTMTEPISDLETFSRFCEIIPSGCTQWDDTMNRMPIRYTVRHRLFYYLISAFTMFILEQPGHPVGTPFPGGFRVEEKKGKYYCLIRDREKEVPYSLCNYCPALQSDDDNPDHSR